MGSYIQMGHHTENLIGETDLDLFKGIVISPLNRLPSELKSDILTFKERGNYDIVLDPQLYYPRTDKDKIFNHPYFPNDFETADSSSLSWWQEINLKVIEYALDLKVDTIVSPVIDPKKYNDDYYHICVETSNHLFKNKPEDIKSCLTTLMINTEEITDEEFLMKIASYAALSETNGFYIVLKNDLEPRREHNNEQVLFSMLRLIYELKQLNKEIFISFSNSDMILFKCAGATNCGTGKFFNLRRFTKSRYEEPSGGGGQLPYWFEHNLMAFIRQSDIFRLKENGFGSLLGGLASTNHWSNKIVKQFDEKPEDPWLGLSWRQYLSWFSKTEEELGKTECIKTVKEWLKKSELNWLLLEDKDVLMEELRNDGSWLRVWRQAIAKLSKI